MIPVLLKRSCCTFQNERMDKKGKVAAFLRCPRDGQNHAGHDFAGAPRASKHREGRFTECISSKRICACAPYSDSTQDMANRRLSPSGRWALSGVFRRAPCPKTRPYIPLFTQIFAKRSGVAQSPFHIRAVFLYRIKIRRVCRKKAH
jgi:hypothetical protein